MAYLEISVGTTDILASLQFYRALGFDELSTTDTWPHNYAAITDGQVVIGLHGAALDEPRVTLVLPDLQKQALRLGDDPSVQSMRIDPDTFNEIELRDADGHELWLLEARTFSPSADATSSLLGRFLEATLPVSSTLAAARFWAPWSRRSIALIEQPRMHLRLDVGGLPVGLSEMATGRKLRLSWLADDLAKLGLALSHQGRPMDACGIGLDGCAGLIESPEGLQIAIFESDFTGAVAG